MLYSHLSDRTVIALSGEDRIPFLQGLITNDANLLTQDVALYAAMLSPQGKFLHDFFLIPNGEEILLDINKHRAADLIARLNIYKLRSKISIQPIECKVSACWDAPAPPPLEDIIADPRLSALGWRIYGDAKLPEASLADYETHRITLGIPDGATDMHIDKSFLLEFAFENLHGVSFSKGCYVGQEVTARSKFRGQVRKQIYCVSSEKILPTLGATITSNGMPIGELRSTSGHHGIALLKIEELEKITAPLMAGDVQINYHLPEWYQ